VGKQDCGLSIPRHCDITKEKPMTAELDYLNQER